MGEKIYKHTVELLNLPIGEVLLAYVICKQIKCFNFVHWLQFLVGGWCSFKNLHVSTYGSNHHTRTGSAYRYGKLPFLSLCRTEIVCKSSDNVPPLTSAWSTSKIFETGRWLNQIRPMLESCGYVCQSMFMECILGHGCNGCIVCGPPLHSSKRFVHLCASSRG